MNQLISQTKDRQDVELLALFDNKKRSLGDKRNDLLNLARGDYLVFIDDDDRISDSYVDDIINTLNANPETDCVVFDCICSVDGGTPKLCKYGTEFEYGDILLNNVIEWRGKPAHTMVYKSSIAKRHMFPSINNGEDVDWVIRACKDITIQTRIDKVLYWYDANYNTTSETSNQVSDEDITRNVEKLRIQQMPRVSYVCLIYKSTKWLQFVHDQLLKYTDMTNADYFFVANDATPEVKQYLLDNNIPHIVHENTPDQKLEWYINNVYRAWNAGAKHATGDYIIFINSDMAFTPNWAKTLIDNIQPNRVLNARLVERGILRSGTYGIEKHFGNNPADYREFEFQEYAKTIQTDEIHPSGLFMPILIRKADMEQVGWFPEGNIVPTSNIFSPQYAVQGQACISGDKVFIQKLATIGIQHSTHFGSIVYHFQEGEMRD